jgi:transcriptional regulator with XRE-family HTH domain
VTSRGVLAGASMAEAFGVVLQGARTRRDLTLDEVARRASVSSNYVVMLESGIREPELSRLINLAAAIGVSPMWLLEEAIAWRAVSDPAVDAEWEQARDERMRAIATAFASALLTCSDRELAVPLVVGERILDQLARRGLMVTAVPRDPASPPKQDGPAEDSKL